MINGNDLIDEQDDGVKEPVIEATEQSQVGITILTEQYYKGLTEKEKETAEFISLPSQRLDQLLKLEQSIPKMDLNSSAESKKWRAAVADSSSYLTQNGIFTKTLSAPNVEFKQHIEDGESKLSISPLNLKKNSNTNISGEYAYLQVVKQLNLGEITHIPLVHSGFWVTVKPPSEREIISLYQNLINEKINLGRLTGGYIYSNFSSFFTDRVIDLILSNVYSTSVKQEEMPIRDLKEKILLPDLFTLIWGFACSMYPNGFEYERPCMSDPENCKHISKEKLNLNKLYWVNNRALTTYQKNHMSVKKQYSRSIEQVKKHIDDHQKPNNSYTVSGIKFNFKIPTLSEYINTGDRWVTSIIDEVENIASSKSDNDKNEHINTFAQSTLMRHYRHWVKSLEINDNVIEDEETLDKIIDEVSAVDEIRLGFHNAVATYIETVTVAVIGIPTYECPSCGETQSVVENKESPFVNVIPLDVLQLFFDLIIRRMTLVINRTIK